MVDRSIILNCAEYTQYLRDYYWINWFSGWGVLIGIGIIVLIIAWIMRRNWAREFNE